MLTRLLCALALVAASITPVIAQDRFAFPMGGQTIVVTSPEGFEPITEHMAPAYEAWTALTSPANAEPFAFITHHDADIARAGEIPSYQRSYSVQYLKSFADTLVTRSEMAQFKAVIREKNADIVKQLNLGDMAQHTSDAVSKVSQAKVDVRYAPIVPMAPHDEGDAYLSYSAAIHLTASVQGADGQAHQLAVTRMMTLSFVWVKGRVVFLYVYGNEHDLDWTRTAAKTWVNQVLAANR